VPTDRWLEVRVRPGSPNDGDRRAALVSVLVALGSAGVKEDGDALIGYVASDSSPVLVHSELVRVDPDASVDVADYIADDWTVRWREGVRAHDVGPLRVAPPWLADPSERARTVVIDPGLAFGTGEHQSTRGVLRLLARAVRDGDTVADVGAGSAVLAIAAIKLGARRVAAIEIDPDAIASAEANLVANGVADQVSMIAGDATTILPLVAPVDLMTVNIVSGTIVALLPVIQTSLAASGRVIIGGMLIDERPSMLEALASAGWRVHAHDIEDGWWSAIIERA
jgi:ribosomal protein L11 methyltransferase